MELDAVNRVAYAGRSLYKKGVIEMIAFHQQYIVDEKSQRQTVIVSVAEWEQILEELEELDSIRAYDAVKAKSQGSISLDQALRELDGNKNG